MKPVLKLYQARQVSTGGAGKSCSICSPHSGAVAKPFCRRLFNCLAFATDGQEAIGPPGRHDDLSGIPLVLVEQDI